MDLTKVKQRIPDLFNAIEKAANSGMTTAEFQATIDGRFSKASDATAVLAIFQHLKGE